MITEADAEALREAKRRCWKDPVLIELRARMNQSLLEPSAIGGGCFEVCRLVVKARACRHAREVVAERAAAPLRWTGPRDGDVDAEGKLLRDLPPERWPYCLPQEHDEWCDLRCRGGVAGSYCDCDASDESAVEP